MNLIERLRALREAATPGPYRAHDHNDMARVGADPDDWIGYAWVGRVTKNSRPDGAFDAGWAAMDRRKDGCKEYRERASADAHFVAETLNAAPELIAEIERLTAQVERMRAALEPFKREADRIAPEGRSEHIGDSCEIWQVGNFEKTRSKITYGDLRRAALSYRRGD